MMSRATSAVVLARGLGSRMRHPTPGAVLRPEQEAAARAGLKGMIPDDAGRPFLAHVLSTLADAGVTDVCLVVAPDHAAIHDYFIAHPPTRIRLGWAVQVEPRGTADALLAAAPWIAGREVLVLNADNLYPVGAIRALVETEGAALIAFDAEALVRDGNIAAERIAAFALITVDAHGMLASIEEKPDPARLRLNDGAAPISMNLWRVDAPILDACRRVAPSPRGELELPQAVALAVREGHRVSAIPVAAGVLDLSHQDDIHEVAQQLATARCLP